MVGRDSATGHSPALQNGVAKLQLADAHLRAAWFDPGTHTAGAKRHAARIRPRDYAPNLPRETISSIGLRPPCTVRAR